MRTVSVLEYHKSKWNNELERHYEDLRQEGIARRDYAEEWFKTITPLQLYCYYISGIKEKNGNIVEEHSIYEDSVFMQTSVSFYGNFEYDGDEFCLAKLFKCESNLDLWTIRLEGNDDTSYSKDILGIENAYDEWCRLQELASITEDVIEGYYFSN